jgi:hypothetical protein
MSATPVAPGADFQIFPCGMSWQRTEGFLSDVVAGASNFAGSAARDRRELAGKTPALAFLPDPDMQLLVEPGRTLLRTADRTAAQVRRAPQRRGTGSRNQRLPRLPKCRSETHWVKSADGILRAIERFVPTTLRRHDAVTLWFTTLVAVLSSWDPERWQAFCERLFKTFALPPSAGG